MQNFPSEEEKKKRKLISEYQKALSLSEHRFKKTKHKSIKSIFK